ncbi:GNAT family N-acetyltransferase [Kitasatospora sp. NPDC127067]|uniref:GNAT family N-acetyltransferase n=1 Tax=Kitasatospora sp. NPDC127067 TaxID=3347126 RepID=UPI003666EBDA
MTPAHAAQVLEIYRSGIDGGDATFETGVPSWEAFDAARTAEHRLVALDGFDRFDRFDRVLGWAAVARVSERSAYAGVVEHSVSRERIGRRHGRWRDVLLLERRSPAVG